MAELTVILPTHNPHAGRLERTLRGLRAQTLPKDRWELLVVDNRSEPPLDLAGDLAGDPRCRLVREAQLGLSAARRRGFAEARTPLCVLVDDDNVLSADYLEHVLRIFAAHARLGAIGGKCLPEFERAPAPWLEEFYGLLALRDLGNEARLSRESAPNRYPVDCAPVGAGMALRREAARAWLETAGTGLADRRGRELSSAGDNDIVLTALRHGWQVGYFPELRLTHLIPAARLEPEYLARLNRGIQKSWMQVLAKHAANPWPPIPAWTVPLRKARAWFAYRAWASRSAYIRWQGACGHFEGRAG